MAPTFSIVIPTYRRGSMLARVLPSYLDTGALEVVVVDDGSGEQDRPILALIGAQPGVRLVGQRHLGLPRARNTGVAESKGEWVVFGEDDAWFTPEYPRMLIDHAIDARALIASGSAPLVDQHMLSRPRGELEELIRSKAMTDRPADQFLGLPWPVDPLESGDVMTPLLTAGAAIHRSVFDSIQFDPAFGGNAFREESDFFFSCLEAGIRMIRCPHAKCGHMKSHSRAVRGGAWDMSRAGYAFQMARNNWRLLRKHEALLRSVRTQAGRHGGALTMQFEFLFSLLRRSRPVRA
jgi:glycosyltransferase involved in cell wall biosynthesis